MMIDISHCAASSADEVIKASKQPVVASHSCADSLCPSGRNLKNRQIKAIAEKGGLVGVTFVYFICDAITARFTITITFNACSIPTPTFSITLGLKERPRNTPPLVSIETTSFFDR